MAKSIDKDKKNIFVVNLIEEESLKVCIKHLNRPIKIE